MKNQLLFLFLIFTSISYSQTWNLIGSTKEAKLIKNGTGLYVLKYKSEYGIIYTAKITRQRREEGNFPKNLGEGGFLGFFKMLGPSQEEESVSAVYEFCKTDDPDYDIIIMWANITYNYEYKFKGVVSRVDVFGELVDTWFIK